MKTYTIKITEDEVDTLLMGLRYLELHHIGENMYGKKVNYQPLFNKLLGNIYIQLKQISFIK